MRALRDKKGMFGHSIIIASVAALLGTSALAETPALRRRPAAPSVDPDMHRVVPQKCVPAQGQFVWNFEEEELINVLRQVSDMLCWNIVMTDTINKNMKMTIIGKSPLTKTDARDVLMAALAAKGLALIEQGKTWTVIKRAESKNFSTPFYSEALNVANNESIGTLFYKAQHTTPDALRNIAKMLVSKDGIVEPAGEQFLIVIDSNSNIKRLGMFFAQIDVNDAANKIHVIKLKHADIKTVEKQVRELFDVAGGMGPGGPRGRRRPGEEGRSGLNIKKIIADERTNSLIVEADEDTFQKLLDVVNSTLDLPLSDMSNKGKIHVYRMRHGDAKKVSDTLNNVVKTGGSRGRRPFPRRDEESSELFEGDVQVTAHESSNMIVIVASQNDYNSLLPTIMRLDAKRKQVYIDAAIMDIRISNNNDFGINLFGGLKGPGDTLGFLGNPGGNKMVGDLASKAAVAGTAASNLGLAGGQALGALAVLNNFVNGGVLGLMGAEIPGTKLPSFGAVLQALSTNTNVDILSTPSGLTSDNEKFKMKVGKKVPTVKGTSSAGGGALGGLSSVPLQNIAYEPVELSFEVTPHVGEGANGKLNVRLEIKQEVNELGEDVVLLSGNQKAIQTKSAETTIVLDDQQTGIIGGLMHNKTTKTEEKIPFLGDIPLLGHLFKKTGTTGEKANLLLVITPYIIDTEEDFRKLVDKKFKEREEFAAMYFGGKIKTYNPYVDYDKKSGPVSSMLLAIDSEMNKPENGGPGDGTETIIKPKDKASDSYQVVPVVSAETAVLQKDFVGDDNEVAKTDLFGSEIASGLAPAVVDSGAVVGQDISKSETAPGSAPAVLDGDSRAVVGQDITKSETAPGSAPAVLDGDSRAVIGQDISKSGTAPGPALAVVDGDSGAAVGPDISKSETAPGSVPAVVGDGSEAVAEPDIFEVESVPVSSPPIELDE